MNKSDEWVIDVTMWPKYCFCPYDGGDVVLGLMLVQDKCPGKLVAAIHMDGQETVEQWCANNPQWKETYSKP